MGLSKANELLLLGKKIDARTALERNICSEVIDDIGNDNVRCDPFHPHSLASKMCDLIDSKLLSLPKSGDTVKYFVASVKGRRRKLMEQVLHDELLNLDARFDNGDVEAAARQLRIGGSTPSPVSQRPPSSKL